MKWSCKMMRWFLDVEPFRRDPLQFLLDRTFGFPEKLEELALGPRAHYLVTDPKLARQILKSDEDFIDKGRLVRKLRPLIGKSHLTISGEEHRKRRNVLHTQLARGVANRYVGAMSAVIRRAATGMMRERRFDAHQVTGPLAVSLACVALFGDNVMSSGDRQILVGAMKSIEDEIAAEMFRAWPHTPWSYFFLRKRRKPALDAMSFVVQRIRKSAPESSILRSLEGLELTDEQIRDEVLTMLLAGHHTTGTAGAWILYHLAVQPGLAEAIAQETREITDAGGEVIPARLNDAKVSLALVREVLRLYPSAWWFSREVKHPITLAKRKLKPGSSLIISPWQMHRDSRFWDDPHAFSLDRHYGDAYMPFGAGPRACVGMGVAMLEMQLLALELAASVELSTVSATPAPWPKPSVTLVPPDILIEITPRETRRSHSFAA
jgi:cytochrome P450